MKSYIFYLIIPSLILSSCRLEFNKTYTETLRDEQELSGISRIKLSGIMNFHLAYGDDEKLVIEGNEHDLEDIEVITNGSELEIRLEKNGTDFFETQELEVFITVKDLELLQFEGVGNVKTESTLRGEVITIRGDGVGNIQLALEAEKIDAEFNMLGNVTLEGKSTYLKLQNSGMGNINAEELVSENVELISEGIGKVAIHSTGILSLEVNGIGTVSYLGSPEIIKNEINGIGKVIRKKEED